MRSSCSISPIVCAPPILRAYYAYGFGPAHGENSERAVLPDALEQLRTPVKHLVGPFIGVNFLSRRFLTHHDQLRPVRLEIVQQILGIGHSKGLTHATLSRGSKKWIR